MAELSAVSSSSSFLFLLRSSFRGHCLSFLHLIAFQFSYNTMEN
jgi:hypothetical protein